MFSPERRAKPPADSGALLEWVLDKDREVVYSLDENRRFRMVRGATARLWGYQNEELLGLDFVDMVMPKEQRTVLSAFDGHRRGRWSGQQETHFRKRDGSPIRMVWKLAEGPVDGAILGQAREFAVRKPRAESRAWEAVGAEAYQRALDEHAIVSLADAEGRILAVNDKFCELSGYGREELVGKDYRLVNSGHHAAPFFQDLWRAVKAGEVWKGEIRNRAKDGAHYWVATTVVPVPGPGGAPVYCIAIQADITALRTAEEAVRQVQKLESLKAFAGGAAHDFSNLITSILGNCHLGMREVDECSRVRAIFERIEKAADRGGEVTNQLLAYLGHSVAVMERVDLNGLVLGARELLQAMAPPGAALDFHLDPGGPLVLADPGQLLQVVRTLAVNAFEAVAPGCTVTVRTGREQLQGAWTSPLAPNLTAAPGAYGFLEVVDDGAGMTPEVLRKVFDPFFTTKFIGRGLGLPALVGIVRNHQGTVRIHSEPGRGTAVQVLLPAPPW